MTTTSATDLDALRAIAAAQAKAYLSGLAKLAADSPSAMGMVGSRANRITGYYIADRILSHPMDLTQAYLSIRAARLAVRLIEGDSSTADALDEIETEALAMLGEIAENSSDD